MPNDESVQKQAAETQKQKQGIEYCERKFYLDSFAVLPYFLPQRQKDFLHHRHEHLACFVPKFKQQEAANQNAREDNRSENLL